MRSMIRELLHNPLPVAPSAREVTIPDVPRNQGSFVPPLVADSSRDLRNVMTKPRLLFRMPLRRSAPGPEPTQERSRSLLSRNGVMFLLRNLVWLKRNSLQPSLMSFNQRSDPNQVNKIV